jgi:hypothetical protein
MFRVISAVVVGVAAITVAMTSGRSNPAETSAIAIAQVAEQLTPISSATMHAAPGGAQLAQLDAGSMVTTLARERGWVRVRLEGWVREDELTLADSLMRQSPSAADVRADPAGMKGRLVRWDMEFISLQRADPLRRDMTADEWYILARGPAGENAISYLVVPAALRSTAESLPPLSRILVTARVRVGRSNPVGVPILDVESLTRR